MFGVPARLEWVTLAVIVAMSGCGGDGNSPRSGAAVSGYVRDGMNSPIAAVVVQIGSATTTTDALGWYEIPGLPPGTYDVNLTKSGYLDGWAARIAVQTLDCNIDLRLRKQWQLWIAVYDATIASYYNSYLNEYRLLDTNFGSSETIEYSETGTTFTVHEHHFGFVGFDLSAIPPDAQIIRAQFTVHRKTTNAVTVGLARVLGPWSEHAITYNNRPGSQPCSSLPDSVSLATGVEMMSLNLRDYVAEVIAGAILPYGITFMGDYCTFYSRESRRGPGPQLFVDCVF